MTALDPEEQHRLALAQRDPRKRLGPYLLLDELGRGGMGVVYKGYDPRIGRKVAIKVLLDPGAQHLLARFAVEAKLASRIQHPNLAQVFELSTADPNAPFLVQQFVSGVTLRKLIADARPRALSPERIARYVADVADAVAAAHAVGVLHRDLKPANVMITPDDRAVVLDFGLAKLTDDPHGLTRTGELVGTVNYMAPELATDDHPAGTPVDIYGLGGILYECLTHQAPYVGTSQINVLSSLIHRPPHAPSVVVESGVDPRLEAICLRCLARDPNDRYPDAAAVADALRDLDPAPAPRAPRRRSIGPAALVAGGAGILALGAAVLVASQRAPDEVTATASPTLPKPTSSPVPGPAAAPDGISPIEQARAALRELILALISTDRQPIGIEGDRAWAAGERQVRAARAAIDAAIARAPADVELSAIGADAALRVLDLPDAIRRARAILVRDPGCVPAQRTLLAAVTERHVLFDQTHAVPASVMDQEALEAKRLPHDPERQLRSVICQRLLVRDAQGALELIARSMRGDGKRPLELGYWHAVALLHTGRADQYGAIERILETVFRHAPRHRRGVLARLVLALRRGDSLAHMRSLIRRVGLRPYNAFALVQVAMNERLPYEEALALLDEARSVLPRHPLVPWARALRTVVAHPDEPERAARILERALKLDPTYANALATRAQWRIGRGDLAGARSDLELAVEAYPDGWAMRLNLARVLRRMNEPKAAIDVLLRGNPRDNPAKLIRRGRALAILDHGLAIRDYGEAIRLLAASKPLNWKPLVIQARLLRGDLYRLTKQHARAVADYQAYFRLNPQDTTTRARLARYLKAHGR